MFKNFILSYKILNKDLRKSYIVLIFFILLSAIFEALSIGIMLPFLAFLSSIETYSSKLPLFLQNFIEGFTNEQLAYLSLFFLILVFIIKFLIVLLTSYLKFDFNSKVQINLSENLLKKYLNLSVEFFSLNNSNKLIRNLTTEVDGFSALLLSYQYLINEVVISLLILGILLFFNFELTISILIVGVILSITFLQFTKSRIYDLGKLKQSSDYIRIKNLNEAFQGIKELKMYSAENFFSELFVKSTSKRSNSLKWYRFFQQVPRISVEAIILVGFIIFYFYFINLKNDLNEFVITGSMYAICTMRLAPSITKILMNFQQVKYSTPIINNISKENQLNESKFKTETTDLQRIKNHIKFESIDISFQDKKILDDINLKIEIGKFYGITGASGSGKSTLINLLCGLIKPTGGNFIIDENKHENMEKFKKNFSYVPQNIFLIQGSIKDNIAFGSNKENIDTARLDKSIELSGLKNYISKLSENIDTLTGERGLMVSGGQMQRIAIARAIYKDSPIIILDEFTSALDDELSNSLIENLKKIKDQKTIIFSSHNKKNLGICDSIISIDNGTVKISPK
jgi:ATP-binding cassette, subfamily B, bacterial PglK